MGERIRTPTISILLAVLLTGLMTPLAIRWLSHYIMLQGGTSSLSSGDPDIESDADSTADNDWPTPPPTFMAASQLITTTVTPRPEPSPRPTATIRPLPTPAWKQLNYLTSVKITTSTIVEAKRTTPIVWFGDIITDKILVKAVGNVLIGVDLDKISNVEVMGRSITVSLPNPEVIAVELMPKESQIYDSERVLFLSQYDGLENDALELAIRQLRNEVTNNGGFMDLARTMTELQLTDFLESMGYDEVEINFPFLDTDQTSSQDTDGRFE